MFIPITDEMRSLAEEMAQTRNGTKQPWQDTRYGENDDLQTHVIGALGEIAVAQALGLDVDKRELFRGDGGIDLEIHTNLTIDVKTRAHSGRATYDLALDEEDPGKVKADILVLAVVSDDGIRLMGWTTKIALWFEGEQMKLKSLRWAMPYDKLYKFVSLSAYVRRLTDTGIVQR